MAVEFDLRQAINCVSDVVMNRPLPLREFDQIYMKVADMVIQAHFIATRCAGQDVIFIGDGDAIGLAVMHLATQRVFEQGPRRVRVLDFDERIVKSITRFAENNGFGGAMDASLYNVVDPLPSDDFGAHDAFYTNPPWGASNEGESVNVFLSRGIEACRPRAVGTMVIADDPALEWTQRVLYSAQRHAANYGFGVAEMVPNMHLYHLDDAPTLRSCACLFRRVHPDRAPKVSVPLERWQLERFYGREGRLKIRYIRAVQDLNYGRAPESSYDLEELE